MAKIVAVEGVAILVDIRAGGIEVATTMAEVGFILICMV